MTPTVLAIAVPVILGLVEVFKKLVPSKFAPLISVILGVGVVTLFANGQFNVQILLVGIMTGLSASGLYSGSGATVEGIKTAFGKKDKTS